MYIVFKIMQLIFYLHYKKKQPMLSDLDVF